MFDLQSDRIWSGLLLSLRSLQLLYCCFRPLFLFFCFLLNLGFPCFPFRFYTAMTPRINRSTTLERDRLEENFLIFETNYLNLLCWRWDILSADSATVRYVHDT